MNTINAFLLVVRHIINAGGQASFIELATLIRVNTNCTELKAQQFIKLMAKQAYLNMDEDYNMTLTKKACDKVRAINSNKSA